MGDARGEKTMLDELTIKSIGGITSTTLAFHGRFIVITGESGAGKSSIVRGIEFIAGRRAQNNLINTQAETCEAQAIFTSKPIPRFPESYQPQEQTLILSRSFSRSGKGQCKIQGQTVPLNMLAYAASQNLAIQSQFAQLSLLDPQRQISIVDSCGGLELSEVKKSLQEVFNEALQTEKKLLEIKKQRSEIEERFDKAPMILKAAKSLELTPDCLDKWDNEYNSLDKKEETRQQLAAILLALTASEGGLYPKLERICQKIYDIVDVSDEKKNIVENALDSLGELTNFVSDLTKEQMDESEIEEQKETLESKMGLVRKLLRAAQVSSVEQLIEYVNVAEEKLAWLASSRQEVEELENIRQTLRKKTADYARQLREMRKNAAALLAEKVNKNLADMAMEYAKFGIMVEELGSIRASGAENIVFTLSIKGGEALPVARNASGGELSRILIALQVSSDPALLPDNMIFDEVEAGLGGKTAFLAGQKLKELSRVCPTILITHEASIAAMADQHFVVRRFGDETRVEEISGSEREKEIARMLAGEESSEAIEHAKVLLANNQMN